MSVSPEMSEILVAVAPKPGLENVKFVGYVICQNIVQLGDAVEQNLTVLEEAETLVAQSTALLRSIRNAVDAERSWVYVKGALLVRIRKKVVKVVRRALTLGLGGAAMTKRVAQVVPRLVHGLVEALLGEHLWQRELDPLAELAPTPLSASKFSRP